MSDNMRFYEQGRQVPKTAQKSFDNGRFKGTDINPMWRIKKLTEMFGPVGFGWYTEVTRQDYIPTDEGNTMVFVDINLYVKDGDTWSKPIFGTGGNTLKVKGRGDDDGYKKAYTDALGIACKALGIGADIWYSNDADRVDPTSKYSDSYKPRQTQQERDIEPSSVKQGNSKGTAENAPETICERCGKPIRGAQLPDKSFMTAEQVCANAVKKYHGKYCFKCCMEIKKTTKAAS